jgi:multiple antibiotic resistance protein
LAYLCRVKLNPEFFNQLLTVTFTLFAVIDIIGSIPLLHALKKKIGSLNEGKATLISGALMVLFLFGGEQFLRILGVDQRSFAVGGSIVIFILGLEMVLGIELFKSEPDAKASVVVPIAFPLIAGSGTLTTIMSLKANYETTTVLLGIMLNLLFIFLVLKSMDLIERILGPAGMIATRKFFGVILLAIAVKIFSTNLRGLLK